MGSGGYCVSLGANRAGHDPAEHRVGATPWGLEPERGQALEQERFANAGMSRLRANSLIAAFTAVPRYQGALRAPPGYRFDMGVTFREQAFAILRAASYPPWNNDVERTANRMPLGDAVVPFERASYGGRQIRGVLGDKTTVHLCRRGRCAHCQNSVWGAERTCKQHDACCAWKQFS